MAFTKNIDTASGAAATYWRIVRAEYDLRTRTIFCTLAGYVSEQARAAGKTPLKEETFLFALPAGVEPEAMTRTALYAAIKTAVPFPGADPMFAGAEDA